MKRAWIRSTLFNITFFAWSLLCCILYIPTFFFPRPLFIKAVKAYLRSIAFLERTILNLHYEVKGLEHLPKDSAYIVAAKHQSAYETLKLHLLFNDPAVILKHELLNIPFWGQYLKKADVIAIDRSSPDAAIQSIQSGAQRMKAQKRPIIIFPQGTRVRPNQTAKDKPYKVGIARIQEATDLPIIPLALNAGTFWPRNSWGKTPGTITFEFLPPIASGMERSKLIAHIEETVETHSNALMNAATKP